MNEIRAELVDRESADLARSTPGVKELAIELGLLGRAKAMHWIQFKPETQPTQRRVDGERRDGVLQVLGLAFKHYGVLTLIAMEVTGCETAGMEITPEQFKRIEHCLPVQRGNVSLSNLQVVNAMLYVAEHGCKWRGLPKRFGNWHTIYTRMRRWTKAGVLDKMFEELQREQLVRVKIEAVSLDSTSIKVHPDGTGALKKTAHRPLASPEADGTPRFIWLPRMLERP